MDHAELAALLTPEGLRLLDDLGAVGTVEDAAGAVSRLRAAGHSPDLVSAVVSQARLRVRARAKFGEFAQRMLFTRAGLEQATRLQVAARHAGRFRDAGIARVADLGCGIGGDALGIAGLGIQVLAVDADEVTAALAAYNLAPFGDAVTARHAKAEEVDLDGVDGVWLDPARRTAGHTETRRLQADDWSPSLEWAFDVAERLPTGIKLGPAFDRDRIPPGAEAQWISVDGSTVELVVWSGALARESAARSALVIRGGTASELVAAADTEDAPLVELPHGGYLHEPEGAVIRARLIGDVARQLDAGMIAEGIAYLAGEKAVTSPFVQTFRVRDVVTAKPAAINAWLKANDIGVLEIKKRGMDVDPAAFRRKLTLRGSGTATLILTRIGPAAASKRVAILAERVPTPAS